MGADCINGAVIHNNDTVCILHRCDALCNNQCGNIIQILTECVTNAAVGSSINGTGAVIQNDDFWFL